MENGKCGLVPLKCYITIVFAQYDFTIEYTCEYIEVLQMDLC